MLQVFKKIVFFRYLFINLVLFWCLCPFLSMLRVLTEKSPKLKQDFLRTVMVLITSTYFSCSFYWVFGFCLFFLSFLQFSGLLFKTYSHYFILESFRCIKKHIESFRLKVLSSNGFETNYIFKFRVFIIFWLKYFCSKFT